jgi:photosystem II stability/assembly factor-like uncharacterized protein
MLMQRRRGIASILSGLLLLTTATVIGGASAVAGSRGTAGGETASSASVIGVVRLVSAGFGVVEASPVSSPGTISRPRLFATSSTGGQFNEISPRLPPFTVIDDVSFLDRDHGWLVAWNVNNVGVTVYRTTDAGRTWQGRPVTTHTQNAGAVATVQFLNPRRGWLVSQEPTAPRARLYSSSDGGANWRLVNDDLPEIAPVVFASADDAWQAGGFFSRFLFHSVDGGQIWTRAKLPVPASERSAKAMYGPPVFFGHTILAPVTFLHPGAAHQAVYRSGDDGRSWKLASVLKVTGATAPGGDCAVFPAPLPISLESARTWWVGGLRAGGWFAYRTTNAGRSWEPNLIAHAKPSPNCPRSELQAIDSRTAWFTFLAGTNDRELYATTDAGKHWRRIRPS